MVFHRMSARACLLSVENFQSCSAIYCHSFVVGVLDIFYRSVIILEHCTKNRCTMLLPLQFYQCAVYERRKPDVLREHRHCRLERGRPPEKIGRASCRERGQMWELE